ncbi:7576_t:CDS:1, partial [Ambispora leptoticha]
MESISEKEKKLEHFFADKVRKVIGDEELNKLGKEAEEEIYKQIVANPNGNQQPNQKGPNQQDPSQQPNQKNNNNSAKITQLQQEINGLRQEI